MAKKPVIVEKNEGTKIPWRVSGTKLYFGEDDDMMLNLSKRQREYPVYEDVCADKNGNLVLGTGAGRFYVAQVEIPPFDYPETDNPEETPDPFPLDIETVTVTLWSIDGVNIG